MQAAAYLYGLDSVSLEKARVLELGCAGGGNILPFAVAYVQTDVVGVDLSAVQVEQGKAAIAALGLANVKLHAMSLTDIDESFGQFDYIIAHGVFSWVPPEVRQAMLQLLRARLSPKGVAYISYNTYPGWKAGDTVRDAMLLHSHSAHSGEDKLAAAKAMLNLLSDGISASNPLAPSLRAAVAQLRTHSDYYIAHEYLELFNNPCYLLEFAAMAQEFGVVHVGDSEPHVELGATFGQNVQLNHSLIALSQPRIMRQQYLDFAVGRNFRKSLLVHAERSDDIATSPELEKLADLRWAGHFTQADSPEGSPKERVSFTNHKNNPLHTSEIHVLAVIRCLSQVWPRSLTVDELVIACSPTLPELDAEGVRQQVLAALHTLFKLNSLRYTLAPSPYDKADYAKGEHPRLIPGVQWLYKQKQDPAFGVGMFNLWHDSVNIRLAQAEAWLLPYIDGTHSRKQLASLLRDALTRGTVPNTDGKLLKGQRNLDTVADKIVVKLLDLLKRQGVLV
ncbi:methyltransferase regulatory domain-containing protein [Alcaligenes endophyticus]|uniref:Class I SAM-dependent methyltransferase n=1 Tax=Alcaligenes endophyticus TaxID=1929088 RepID=A0ABT8EL26_9BURK|nr:class I SAM-dependent methyltransferase [Alcaligenes endophyticus]MCX5590640.1 class I SAM-dependent methyltransferase [Alcaligenes endophyticus]MDN4121996.1 class I SAM-dependent methyltransferase [Alcaligenes endophyticus]